VFFFFYKQLENCISEHHNIFVIVQPQFFLQALQFDIGGTEIMFQKFTAKESVIDFYNAM